jgi:hypothetical protein
VNHWRVSSTSVMKRNRHVEETRQQTRDAIENVFIGRIENCEAAQRL